MRERLPPRHGSTTVSTRFGTARLHVNFGTYADGRLAEIFAAGPKIGSDLRTSIQEAVTAASFALQHGARPDEVLSALPVDANGSPEGALGVILALWMAMCQESPTSTPQQVASVNAPTLEVSTTTSTSERPFDTRE